MTEVKTLVYFDLEATGLKSSGRPRICEISLVAVDIQDILQLGLRLNEDKQLCEDSYFPRIVNKLTLCVYPMAIIVPLVTDLTGLDNYNLSDQAKFSKTTGDMINNFLSCLPSPVCLVAHNGNAYDFPLLTAEFEKLGMQLNLGTLCADSLLGMKEILGKRGETIQEEKMEVHAATELLKAGMFETELVEGQKEVLEEITKTSNFCQMKNDLTPKGKQKTFPPSLKQKKHGNISYPEQSKIRKKLYFSTHGAPTSFKLVNLHKHLLGALPSKSHGAEADCLALLRTTAVLGSDWIKWLKANCYMFSNCKKMWG